MRRALGAENQTLGAKAMPSTIIRFYFDYESPNAYLAWTQLPKLAQRYGFTVDPVPILYAALLDAHGQLGPGECPAKGRWMSKNLARKAVLLGVPLNPPAFLPFNPLLALRTTLLPSDTSRLRKNPCSRRIASGCCAATWPRPSSSRCWDSRGPSSSCPTSTSR